jgi:hypothetical protein
MKSALFIVASLAALGAVTGSAQAQNFPWCSYYNGSDGARNCGFVSFEQCQQNVRGIGGFCNRNPQYSPPPGPHHSRR